MVAKRNGKRFFWAICSNPELKDKKLLVLPQKHIEMIKVKLHYFRSPKGVFEPVEIRRFKAKITSHDVILSLMQDLVDSVATYFQNLDPDTVVYVPKCDKYKFE